MSLFNCSSSISVFFYSLTDGNFQLSFFPFLIIHELFDSCTFLACDRQIVNLEVLNEKKNTLSMPCGKYRWVLRVYSSFSFLSSLFFNLDGYVLDVFFFLFLSSTIHFFFFWSVPSPVCVYVCVRVRWSDRSVRFPSFLLSLSFSRLPPHLFFFFHACPLGCMDFYPLKIDVERMTMTEFILSGAERLCREHRPQSSPPVSRSRKKKYISHMSPPDGSSRMGVQFSSKSLSISLSSLDEVLFVEPRIILVLLSDFIFLSSIA